jgi:hypothetical protein
VAKRAVTPRAFLRRAVKLAQSRPGHVISSGEVAYAQLRSERAADFDLQVFCVLQKSGRFERIAGMNHYGSRDSNVSLFKLKESSHVG